MHLRAALTLSLGSVLLACGGGTPPPPPTPSTPTTAASDAGAPAIASGGDAGAAAPAGDKHATAEAVAHVDPNEKDGPIDLVPLFSKATKPTFPKATVGDHECMKGGFAFSGKHQDDFKVLMEKCGTPTGMLEYTKPHEGRLHAKHDKRDEFKIKVEKAMCYRYFAIGDDGIKDIDIIVLRRGALMAMDKTDHHIAVIDHDKLWCVDEDMDLQFNIEVDGPGAGGYLFAVWGKPKGK